MLQQSHPPLKERGASILGRLLRRVDGCDVRLELTGKHVDNMVQIDDTRLKRREMMVMYTSDEAVRGAAVLVPNGNQYSFSGIVVELIGVVMTRLDHTVRCEFLRQERHFDAGTIERHARFEFNFDVDKAVESYYGTSARVSYMVNLTVQRPVKNIYLSEAIWVSHVSSGMWNYITEHGGNLQEKSCFFRETEFGPESMSMEVGVKDILHIEFRYNKQNFHLSERVFGVVMFKIADVDIEYGEVSIVRKEYIHSSPVTSVANMEPASTETLQKFEIMDGTPIVGEVVPIRIFLGCIPQLTPTLMNVQQRFSVCYFLNLVFVTSGGKRYFKQREIILHRLKGQERPSNLQPSDAL